MRLPDRGDPMRRCLLSGSEHRARAVAREGSLASFSLPKGQWNGMKQGVLADGSREAAPDDSCASLCAHLHRVPVGEAERGGDADVRSSTRAHWAGLVMDPLKARLAATADRVATSGPQRGT